MEGQKLHEHGVIHSTEETGGTPATGRQLGDWLCWRYVGVTSCRDRFRNCRVVVQARLCRYAYYRGVCCFSCTSHGYDDSGAA